MHRYTYISACICAHICIHCYTYTHTHTHTTSDVQQWPTEIRTLSPVTIPSYDKLKLIKLHVSAHLQKNHNQAEDAEGKIIHVQHFV